MNQTIFLLSPWYSGATVLTMLLDRHPAIVSNGEGFPFNPLDRRHVCSCGQPLLNCELYKYAASHMLKDSSLFLREPILELPTPIARFGMSPRFSGRVRHSLMSHFPKYRQKVDDFQKAHILFMRRATAYAQAGVYLDGTKSIRRAELLLPHSGESTHLWMLVKDCRSYCASVLRSWKLTQDKVGIPVRDWLDYIRFTFRLARSLPATRFRIVRYEDLCRDPMGTLDSLTSVLGLRYDTDVELADYSPHLLGNRIRFTFDGRTSSVKLSEKWRTELNADTQAEIIRAAGRTMATLGYL